MSTAITSTRILNDLPNLEDTMPAISSMMDTYDDGGPVVGKIHSVGVGAIVLPFVACERSKLVKKWPNPSETVPV